MGNDGASAPSREEQPVEERFWQEYHATMSAKVEEHLDLVMGRVMGLSVLVLIAYAAVAAFLDRHEMWYAWVPVLLLLGAAVTALCTAPPLAYAGGPTADAEEARERYLGAAARRYRVFLLSLMFFVAGLVAAVLVLFL
jgi:cobalamin synthase